VGVDDVRTEATGGEERVTGQREVATPAAAAIHDRPLDLVSTGCELALESGDEDPEVRGVRPWIHLGDEEDPQRATRV
jgi:hypothetical protein